MHNPVVDAIMDGINPHHLIVSGGGATPRDSMGNAWPSNYIVASGNLLAFMIARDTMHQNQRLAAIEELRDGLEMRVCPGSLPKEREYREVTYQFWNTSVGEESGQGRWANGPPPDGHGQFEYRASKKNLNAYVVCVLTELGQLFAKACAQRGEGITL